MSSFEGFNQKVTAWMIPRVMKMVDRRLRVIKKELLKNVKGKVLDVGCASGYYMKYYKESAGKVHTVIALEPNIGMHQKLKDEIKRVGGDFEVEITSSFMEDISGEESFDSIVFGNVLCEIPDYKAALKKAHSLLKPDGRIYFIEHVLDEPGSWRHDLQQIVRPWWYAVSGGCDCARPTLLEMKKMPWSIQHWTVVGGGFPWTARFEIGVATKRRRKE
mmetsp:Transcript_9872/g.18008  ORF Transcript_9872/g.18008 Transcript_9872/m.18008 type:complete len:218 (+) Transcript_9872:2-655(+)